MKENKELYIIIGPLGANQTMFSEATAKLFNMKPIFWGKVKAKSDKNNLGYLRKALSQAFKKHPRIIIDGFPTNNTESLFLLDLSKKLGYSIKCVIQLNISLERIIKNLKNRFICNNCGIFYEDDFLINKGRNNCPNCGAILIKYHTNKKEIRINYYDFFNSVKDISEVLSLYSESYFGVSAEQPKHFVISSIFHKIKNQEKDFHTLYKRKSQTKIEARYGIFKIVTYLSKIDYKHHLAVIKGNVKDKRGVLLRIHSSCITGDILGSLKCDCGEQLAKSLKIIDKSGLGILIYFYQEGRCINIVNKIDAYNLQRKGVYTVEANELLKLPIDMREYAAVKGVLADLKIKSVKILTNNPDKIYKLEELGVVVESIIPLEINPNKHNKNYLSTKKKRLGHKLKLVK